MRKIIVFLIVLSLAVPAVVFAGTDGKKTEWFVGGIVDNIKSYGADEAHGYVVRIDVKRPQDDKDLKKIYVKKDTKVLAKDGAAMKIEDIKTGMSVLVKYTKADNNFIAIEVKFQ